MEVNFKYNEPAEAEKIYFEQIFAEKPGGGVVKFEMECVADIPPTTPVYEHSPGIYEVDPQFIVLEDVEPTSTKINIEVPFYNIQLDIYPELYIGYKGEATKIASAKETGHGVQLTVENPFTNKITKGTVLWASTNNEPSPNVKYVTGDWIYANEGDQAVRLINGANLRKETANIASEVAALLPTINLV